MRRILNPYRIKDIGEVFIEVKYDDGRLSITGVEGPQRNGNCRGGCGQLSLGYEQDDKATWSFNNPWNMEMVDRLYEVWDRWHLNDMNAGTTAQTLFLKEWQRTGKPLSRLDHYTESCEVLRAARLYIVEHPDDQARWGVGRPYRYGTAWLREEVPQDVIDWLSSLPINTRPYPWNTYN